MDLHLPKLPLPPMEAYFRDVVLSLSTLTGTVVEYERLYIPINSWMSGGLFFLRYECN